MAQLQNFDGHPQRIFFGDYPQVISCHSPEGRRDGVSDQRERHLHRTAFGAVQVRVSCSGNFMLENGDSSVASLPQNDILGDVGNHQIFWIDSIPQEEKIDSTYQTSSLLRPSVSDPE
jgi:hypothetical protein